MSVKKGAVVYSDALDLTGIKAGDMVSVSVYLKGGQGGTSVTGHPGARTSSWCELCSLFGVPLFGWVNFEKSSGGEESLLKVNKD